MDQDHIQSILARFLMDPAFIESVRANPQEALSEYRLNPSLCTQIGNADLDRIRRFSGFICKVQHNHLWDWFSGTRAMLNYYGIELDVFTRYRPIQLLRKTRMSDANGRIRRFLEFLREHATKQNFPGLLQVLEHEWAIWEVQAAAAARNAARSKVRRANVSSHSSKFRNLYVSLKGVLAIRSFNFDPAIVVNRVRSGEFDGSLPDHRECTFVYLGDAEAGTLRILEIAPLAAIIISEVDGRRRVGSVIDATRRRGLATLPARAFHECFKNLVCNGLIDLQDQNG